MKKQLLLLWILHVFDAGFTAMALQAQLTDEQNPLLRVMWQSHPLAFFTMKFSLLLLATAVAARYWRDARMRIVALTGNVAMAGVVILEMFSLLKLWGIL